MARLAGWKYNNQTNCYVKPNCTDYPPLPATTMNTSSNAKRQLKVKINTEASTKRNDLVHPHNTRYKNKETTKILMFTHSPLRLPSQNRTLALLNSKVQSPSEPPPTKKSRRRKHIVGCCIYGPKSIYSAKKYFCFSKRRSCIACKSECCMNTTKIVPASSEMRDIILANFKERKAKDSIPETNSRK